MNTTYTISGFVFVKKDEDAKGSYYDIIHPSGRYWDYSHLFRSYDEIVSYVKNLTK